MIARFAVLATLAAAAPITRREARRVLRELAEASFADRGLTRAVRRLQVLGIPDRRARRFLGYWLTRPVDAVLLKYDPQR